VADYGTIPQWPLGAVDAGVTFFDNCHDGHMDRLQHGIPSHKETPLFFTPNQVLKETAP
jgi:hypothetical protein